MLPTATAALLAAALQLAVEAGEILLPVDHILVVRVFRLHGLGFRGIRHVQVHLRLDALLVLREDLAHLLDRESRHGRRLAGPFEEVPHLLAENVGLHVEAGALLGLQLGIGRGIAFDRLDVHVKLIVQAAFKPAALATELCLVDR